MGEERDELLENARAIAQELRREGFSTPRRNRQHARSLARQPARARASQCPPALDPQPESRRSDAGLLDLARARRRAQARSFRKTRRRSLYGATAGSTPFRLNLHVGDVGHTLIFGPTGAGKSTLLATLSRRSSGATRTRASRAFDKGRSLFALAHAAGGAHYDLAGDSRQPRPLPLARLETPLGRGLRRRAGSPPASSCNKVAAPSPRQKEEIHRAMGLLRQPNGRAAALPISWPPCRTRHPLGASPLHHRRLARPSARCARRRHRQRTRSPCSRSRS